jgi:hypothetical protein
MMARREEELTVDLYATGWIQQLCEFAVFIEKVAETNYCSPSIREL